MHLEQSTSHNLNVAWNRCHLPYNLQSKAFEASMNTLIFETNLRRLQKVASLHLDTKIISAF